MTAPYPTTPRVHPDQLKLTAHYDPTVYQLADNAWVAVGYALSNMAMIEGDDGIIIFDTSREVDTAKVIMKEFRKITDKPVKAVIYSHFHPDHTYGVRGVVDEADVKAGRVEIIAHSNLMTLLADLDSKALPIYGQRLRYQFGAYLSGDENAGMSGGMGPLLPGGSVSFLAPTRTFDDRIEITICGIDLYLFHVPSETEDQLVLHLPDTGIAFVGDMLHGPSIPNLYPLWGDGLPRDPEQWADAFDFVRSLNPNVFAPMHGQPVYGADDCARLLTQYRDLMRYVSDQTIRWMNHGLSPEEIVRRVKLPPALAAVPMYMQGLVGTLDAAVRRIYESYMGWFHGDPVDLRPTAPSEKAARMVDMMGGNTAVLKAARSALDAGDHQWSAELTTLLVQADTTDMAARHLKAAALREMGYDCDNAQYRNWYLTSARELDGTLPVNHVMNFDVSDVVRFYGAAQIAQTITCQLRAEDAFDTKGIVKVSISGGCDESFWLEIRQGVALVHKVEPGDPIAHMTLTRDQLETTKFDPSAVLDLLDAHDVAVSGDSAQLRALLRLFETPGDRPILIALPPSN